MGRQMKSSIMHGLNEALERVREAHTAKSSSLDLSDMALVTLPEGIRNLIHLEQLDLSDNNLIEMRGIDRLVQLRFLNLSNNKLKYIPKTIGNLSV